MNMPQKASAYTLGRTLADAFGLIKQYPLQFIAVIAVIVALVFGSKMTLDTTSQTPQSTPVINSIPIKPEVQAKVDCINDEAEILKSVESKIKATPNLMLEILRPCAESTGKDVYKNKVVEAEKYIKINQQAEDKRKQIDAANAAKDIAKAKKSQGVTIGMSVDDVLASSWGKPNSINTTTTSTTVRQQWVYGNRSYLYFTNGVLTTIQN